MKFVGTLLLLSLPAFAQSSQNQAPDRPQSSNQQMQSQDPGQEIDQAEHDLERAMHRFRQAMRAHRQAMEGPSLGVMISRGNQQGGLTVAGVIPESPADKAGVRQGDVLTSFDGQKLNSVAQLRSEVSQHQRGDQAQLEWQRGGEKRISTITFQPSPLAPNDTGQLSESEGGKTVLDIGLANITPELGEYFGVNHGVLVTRSAGNSFGLRGGDVLLSVDGQKVQSPEQAMTMLESISPGDNIVLQVRRKGQTQNVTSMMPQT